MDCHQNQQSGEQQQWVACHVDVGQPFHKQRADTGGPRDYGTAESNPAEQLHRTGAIIQQVFDRCQIQNHSCGARNTVFCGTKPPRAVVGDHFGTTGSQAVGEDRNKAVHFTIEFEFLGDFTANDF